ncbi:putative Trans-aconitate 2-methyltransferase [Desulfamplus magnetovallimortis]|uniref:Putative Trans-aconitate 2-methyltransferase n=1 Tax=Desulfamplus magnetovallimortis TaxID=1246637 RepID=A0A1W1HKY8_9BACT|nr:class I SAM-dependent methyltransferase [Desulfamplus magnetovallimortis]SLM33144.1 putative Trans-aconitate 2-methyltransferase [Desulfamplus magnetovallimortis]
MFLGKEQIYNPSISLLEKLYVFLFGMPIVGLRIRCRNILSLIPKNRDYKNILDAGSGSGVLTFELARKFKNSQVTGFDLDPEEIGISEAIVVRAGYQNVLFKNTDIETMNEKECFDLIICVDILEHIEDDLSALKKLFNALKEDGILVLHVPALYRRYPVSKKSLNFYVPTHVRYGYEIEDIKEKVIKAGFCIDISGYTYGFMETLANNISYMITKAQKKNKVLYAFAFPILNIISLIGQSARPEELGAGVFIVCCKK